MPLNSLKFTGTTSLNWTATNNVAGQASGSTNSNAPSKSLTYSNAIPNAQVGGADELYSLLSTIAASGTLTINLQSFTDILGDAAVSLTRLKFAQIRLIGTGETAPDGTAGTACSGITVGNAGSNPFPFNLVTAAGTFTVDNAGEWTYKGGSAGGLPVSSTKCNVLITNNDASNSAVVLITFVGGTT